MSDAGSATAAADVLCSACLTLLDMDGSWISLVDSGGESSGTLGASSELCQHLDELQFTFGEGPGPSSVRSSRPVLAPDLDDVAEDRWPVFRGVLLRSGVAAVFALPVSVATRPIGAVEFFRRRAGPLTGAALSTALVVAQLAALPLLELAGSADSLGRARDITWTEVTSGARADVYRATGLLMAVVGIGPAEALLRLRARAVARDTTAAAVAVSLLRDRQPPDPLDWSDGGMPRS